MTYWIYLKKRSIATIGKERDHYYNLDLTNTIYFMGDNRACVNFGESRNQTVEITDEKTVAQIREYLQEKMHAQSSAAS